MGQARRATAASAQQQTGEDGARPNISCASPRREPWDRIAKDDREPASAGDTMWRRAPARACRACGSPIRDARLPALPHGANSATRLGSAFRRRKGGNVALAALGLTAALGRNAFGQHRQSPGPRGSFDSASPRRLAQDDTVEFWECIDLAECQRCAGKR